MEDEGALWSALNDGFFHLLYIKAAGEKASRLYELNLLALCLTSLIFGPQNALIMKILNFKHNNYKCAR